MTAFRVRCCLGAVVLSAAALADFGDPLPGLSAGDAQRFEVGKTEFTAVEEVLEGLGPVFNEASCVACHLGPGAAVGGTSQRLETRFGRTGSDGTFDPLAGLGGSLLQDHAIANFLHAIRSQAVGLYFHPAKALVAFLAENPILILQAHDGGRRHHHAIRQLARAEFRERKHARP